MQTRTLGRTGRTVSAIGLGTWQLGADWGEVDEADALAVLDASREAGVTVFDTADVYGDGRSESLIGRWLAANPGAGVTVATKMGRRVPQVPEEELEHFSARRAALARVYNGITKFRGSRWALLAVGPFFQVIAQRTAAGTQPSGL